MALTGLNSACATSPESTRTVARTTETTSPKARSSGAQSTRWRAAMIAWRAVAICRRQDQGNDNLLRRHAEPPESRGCIAQPTCPAPPRPHLAPARAKAAVPSPRSARRSIGSSRDEIDSEGRQVHQTRPPHAEGRADAGVEIAPLLPGSTHHVDDLARRATATPVMIQHLHRALAGARHRRRRGATPRCANARRPADAHREIAEVMARSHDGVEVLAGDLFIARAEMRGPYPMLLGRGTGPMGPRTPLVQSGVAAWVQCGGVLRPQRARQRRLRRARGICARLRRPTSRSTWRDRPGPLRRHLIEAEEASPLMVGARRRERGGIFVGRMVMQCAQSSRPRSSMSRRSTRSVCRSANGITDTSETALRQEQGANPRAPRRSAPHPMIVTGIDLSAAWSSTA